MFLSQVTMCNQSKTQILQSWLQFILLWWAAIAVYEVYDHDQHPICSFRSGKWFLFKWWFSTLDTKKSCRAQPYSSSSSSAAGKWLHSIQLLLLLLWLLVNKCIDASGLGNKHPLCSTRSISRPVCYSLPYSRHSRLIDPTGINHHHPPYSIRKLSCVGHTFWPHILIYGHSLIRGVVWTCEFLFPIIFVQHLIGDQLLIKFILPLQSHQSWWPQISHISAVYCHF